MTGTEDAQPARDVDEAVAWFRGEHPDLLSYWASGESPALRHSAAIVRAALAAGPQPELPQVLVTVEDVATVCRAAGLDTNGDDGWGVLDEPSVTVIPGAGELDWIDVQAPDERPVATVYFGQPSGLLWSAIQIARGAAALAGARPAAEPVGSAARNRDELQQRVDAATLGHPQVRAALDRAAARPAVEPPAHSRGDEVHWHIASLRANGYDEAAQHVASMASHWTAFGRPGYAAARSAGEGTTELAEPLVLAEKLTPVLDHLIDQVVHDVGDLPTVRNRAAIELAKVAAEHQPVAPRSAGDTGNDNPLLTLDELVEAVELALGSSAIEVDVWETHVAETGGQWRTDRTGQSPNPLYRLTRCLRSAGLLDERRDDGAGDDGARCQAEPASPPLVTTGPTGCLLTPGHDGWHEMRGGERWLDPPAEQMVVGKAGVPIDAYDAIELLSRRPDHPSRLLAETARRVADWWNDPPGVLDRDAVEEAAPALAEALWELLGGGPGDVSDARPAGDAAPGDELCRYCPTDVAVGEGGYRYCIECGWTDNPEKIPALYDEIDRLRSDAAALRDAGNGAALILAERRRQVEGERWTAEHDAGHVGEDLAVAACCYALPNQMRRWKQIPKASLPDLDDRASPVYLVPTLWPWEGEAWKPSADDRVRELTKAGALIAAEIDRLSAAGGEA